MYTDKKQVFIYKGFMEFDDFYEKICSINKKIDLESKSCVFHFRIGTSGRKKSKKNCHPFPISDNERFLKESHIITDIGVAMDGLIHEFIQEKCDLSDTMMFIKEFLYPFYFYDKKFLFNKKTKDIIFTITNSKFVFLDQFGNICTIGEFIEDNGLLLSNASYTLDKYNEMKTNIKFYTNERYEDALFEGNSEIVNKIENSNFENSLSKLTILEIGDRAISQNSETEYIGNDKVILGYDANNNLYEIDFRQKKLHHLDENVQILLKQL